MYVGGAEKNRGMTKWVVEMEVAAGRNLVARDGSGPLKLGSKYTSDPYVVCTFGKHKFVSDVVPKTVNPVWNANCRWVIEGSQFDPEDNIICAIFDRDRGSLDDPMGQVWVPMRNLLQEGAGLRHVWHRVRSHKGCRDATGELQLKIVVRPAGDGDGATAVGGKLSRISSHQVTQGKMAWAKEVLGSEVATRTAASQKHEHEAAKTIQQAARQRVSQLGLRMDQAATDIQRHARGQLARARQVGGQVARAASIELAVNTLGSDWWSDPKPPPEEIDRPTPHSVWWTPRHGWKSASCEIEAASGGQRGRRGPPQEVMPTLEEEASLYPEASEVIGELKVRCARTVT